MIHLNMNLTEWWFSWLNLNLNFILCKHRSSKFFIVSWLRHDVAINDRTRDMIHEIFKRFYFVHILMNQVKRNKKKTTKLTHSLTHSHISYFKRIFKMFHLNSLYVYASPISHKFMNNLVSGRDSGDVKILKTKHLYIFFRRLKCSLIVEVALFFSSW